MKALTYLLLAILLAAASACLLVKARAEAERMARIVTYGCGSDEADEQDSPYLEVKGEGA